MPSNQGNPIHYASSSTHITRALRGCFRGGFVFVVSLRFKAKENLQRYWEEVFFYNLITSKVVTALGMF